MTLDQHPSISDGKYVSFTSYKRNGEAVSLPVWIVSLADGSVGFTTAAEAWKVKRIRNNPRVVLRTCDIRGHVRDGAIEASGTASVLLGDACRDIERAVRRKYGLIARLVDIDSWVKQQFGRGSVMSGAINVVLD